jgi:NTE family protein
MTAGEEGDDPTRVAIACQGGGSHTAFTAGALRELLPWLDRPGRELAGISGTSGGAVCGVTAWYGYLAGGAAGACGALAALWEDVAASGPYEQWWNDAVVWGATLRNSGAPLPSFSPYATPIEELGSREFKRVLRRHVDFDAIPERLGPESPRMVVGSVNVSEGTFETFEDEAITADAVLASAALPTVFEGVEIDGDRHWDGLLSQNPPIHELLDTDTECKPDELWVVQINPQREREPPRSLEAILDRRNELGGNLSLNQELRFVQRVNDWVDRGELADDRFVRTTVRRLVFDRELSHASKLDRDADFLAELEVHGRERARAFLEAVEADLGAEPDGDDVAADDVAADDVAADDGSGSDGSEREGSEREGSERDGPA